MWLLRWVMVLLAVLALRLEAQSPNDREALRAFRDSLTAVTDTAYLVSLATQYEGVETGDSTEALASIRAGFARLQAGKPLLAEKNFRRAAKLQPTWPVPWLGLGDAHAALGLATWQNTMNLGTHPGLGEFQKAADAYGKALALDRRFAPAIEGQLRLAVERRDTALLVTAIGNAHHLPRDAATPEFLLALSRAEWRMGAATEAYAALQSVADSQTTPAIRYQRGRAALALGNPLGEVDYWAAVADDDPTMLVMLHRDMSLIATPSELADFDRQSGRDRVAFLHRFWNRHAAISLRSVGERMQEHYRRIVYADRHFAFSEVRHMQKPDDLHSSFPFDSMLDSRGVVYVRMGPPDVRVQPRVCGYVANETWGYHRSDDELLLHFASQNSIGDYVLVRSVQDINHASIQPNGRWNPSDDKVRTVSPDGETAGAEVFSSQANVMKQIKASRTSPSCGEDLFEMMRQRQAVSPIYGKLLSASPIAGATYLQELAVLGKQSITTSTTTEAHPLRFPASVTAQVLPLAIGAAPGGSGVQVAVAVVQPAPSRAGQRDTIRVRFAAFGDGGTVVARFDTTLTYSAPFSPAQPDTTYTIFAHLPATLPAGTWSWQAAVQTGDSTGALLASQLITIPVHDSSALAVSDLAIGVRGWSAPWVVAPGDTVWVTPRNGHRASVPVELYYEVYGIPAGQLYQVEVTARRGDKGTGPSITLGFEEHSAGTPTRVARTLSLNTLTPGDYLLEVRVTDRAGRVASSSRPIKLVAE